MIGWWRRRSRLPLLVDDREAYALAVACPECGSQRGAPCSAQMGYRVEPHAERIAARQERDRTALDWFVGFVTVADPILAEHGYEDEARRPEGGWAHWQKDGAGLAARIASVGDEVWAQLDLVEGMRRLQIPADLLERLVALGARPPFCPECGSHRHLEPLFSCIRD
jgi:hypothetical protein